MGGFRAVAHEGAPAFLARARPFLLSAEAENNLILGVALELSGREATPRGRDGGPWFATVEASGEVVGAAFRTPPHKVGLTRMPRGAARVLGVLAAERYATLPGFLGDEAAATEAAEGWIGVRGGSASIGMRQRLHRLDAVTAPSGVPGRMTRADPDDLPLALSWGEGFARDAGAHFRPPDAAVASWLEAGLLRFWEADGEPVSMAIARGGTPSGVRVGYVYTPPERRGHGYATALVAALSQRLLDEGYRFCVLFTDLANPTSNAIYARVGYRPLCDLIDVELR